MGQSQMKRNNSIVRFNPGNKRSLNRRTDALGRHLYSFRANKLESLAFGTPHWGDASLVCVPGHALAVFRTQRMLSSDKRSLNGHLKPLERVSFSLSR